MSNSVGEQIIDLIEIASDDITFLPLDLEEDTKEKSYLDKFNEWI